MRSRYLAVALSSLVLQACVGDALVLPPASCTDCAEACVDLQTDVDHCGSCDKSCAAGEVCRAGLCALSCPEYLLACAGKCVDPKVDSSHCGAKLDCAGDNGGKACEADQRCAAGTCLLVTQGCPEGLLDCNGACVDPQDSRSFCGAKGDCATEDADNSAGDTCAAGEVCGAGQCALSCPGYLIKCAGKCIDPLVDPAFCGAKLGCAGQNDGESCAAGEACVAGVCGVVCAEGEVVCGGRCVDPASDRAHCGAKNDCSSGDPASVDFEGADCEACDTCAGATCVPMHQQIVIPVEADSYVVTEMPAGNHGAEQEFIVDRDQMKAYLRFDLSGIPQNARILSASLRAYVFTGYAWGGDGVPRVRFVEDDSWEEAALCNDNAPEAATDQVGDFGEQWFDGGTNEHQVKTAGALMGPVVQGELAGDRKASFQIRCDGYRTNYRSKEYGDGSKAATLVVTYSLGSPSSCETLAKCAPERTDGEYKLFAQGRSGQPYTAYCKDMATAPKTYLPLANVGGDFNFAQYTAATNVRTTYTHLRLDANRLLVHIGDQTFASSVGSASVGPTPITSMPYGVAGSCDGTDSGLANINLVGTHFRANDTWPTWNNEPGGAVSSSDGQVWDITGGGGCGWSNPEPLIYEPFNTNGDWNLNLEYVP